MMATMINAQNMQRRSKCRIFVHFMHEMDVRVINSQQKINLTINRAVKRRR